MSYASSSEWARCTSISGSTTIGSIYIHRYSVCRRSDLLERIIPFFRQNPLRTAKRYDFQKFAYCVELMASGHHLTRDGLAEIAEIMQTMNRKKPRHELIGILRGHTPDVRDIGR